MVRKIFCMIKRASEIDFEFAEEMPTTMLNSKRSIFVIPGTKSKTYPKRDLRFANRKFKF